MPNFSRAVHDIELHIDIPSRNLLRLAFTYETSKQPNYVTTEYLLYDRNYS